MLIKTEVGCSRMVFLIGHYAIKLPNLRYRYPAMVWGLIHNLAERNWWRCVEGEFGDNAEWRAELRTLLCPVIWGDRFGFCTIMRRASPLPYDWDCPVVFEWLALRFKRADCACPAEKKIDSFGLLDNEIVAIDYA